MEKEFDYISNPIYMFCDKNKSTAEQRLTEWKKETHFATQ